MMQTIEEAKTALWGQLIDSGETSEEEANALLDSLIDAAKMEERGRLRGLAGFVEPAWETENGGRAGYEFDADDPDEKGIYVLPLSALDPAETPND
jgi:hypothetical protein